MSFEQTSQIESTGSVMIGLCVYPGVRETQICVCVCIVLSVKRGICHIQIEYRHWHVPLCACDREGAAIIYLSGCSSLISSFIEITHRKCSEPEHDNLRRPCLKQKY